MEIQTICEMMQYEHNHLDYRYTIKATIKLSNDESILVDYEDLTIISEEKVLQVRYRGEYRTIYFEDIKDFQYQVVKSDYYYG